MEYSHIQPFSLQAIEAGVHLCLFQKGGTSRVSPSGAEWEESQHHIYGQLELTLLSASHSGGRFHQLYLLIQICGIRRGKARWPYFLGGGGSGV